MNSDYTGYELLRLRYLALDIAKEAHKDQLDKNGKPYFDAHIDVVWQKCSIIESQIVALLHDVIEDTDLTAMDLIDKGIPKEFIDIVLLLTREKGISYSDYIKKVKTNKIAIEVKIADLESNMDITRFKRNLTDEDWERLMKYHMYYVELINL